ncbi:MAG: TerC family protein [bacterium JZ-2024 1]
MIQSENVWWVIFAIVMVISLGLDLGVFHRKVHEIKMKEALIWSIVWTLVALGFNLALYFWKGGEFALVWFTGYLIERALSMDNVFVFVVIFSYFGVPKKYQHPVLYWGIIGALVFRGIFIYSGVQLIRRFEWILYVFGLLLIYTGIKVGLEKEKEIHPEKNFVIRWLTTRFPVTSDFVGSRFFTRVHGKLALTPLFVALVFVELTDIVFAIDSIPAILAISHDPFIVYTSNILAILGLRALYFVLAGLIDLFVYLNIGLAAILVFVGAKMLLHHYIDVPIGWSLSVVVGTLILSIGGSLVKSWLDARKARASAVE